MKDNSRVLVTGASGFVGRNITVGLVRHGFSVKALVRKTSKIDHLDRHGVVLVYGDVADFASLKPAFEGVDYVIHAAADSSGTAEGARMVTVQGTRNILDCCTTQKIKKLIYLSSCSVYGPVDYEDGQVVDENAPLERFPEHRGVYSWAKLEAENLVAGYMVKGHFAIVCLRPGTIYGHGGETYSPMMGYAFKKRIFAVINNDKILPLVYVENLVGAIIAAIVQEKSNGQVYNVVDDEQIRKKQYMNGFIRKLYPRAWCVYVPYEILSTAVWLQEMLFKALKRKPILTQYRLIASQRPIIYDSSKIMSHLGWQPSFVFEKAVERIIEHEKEKESPEANTL